MNTNVNNTNVNNAYANNTKNKFKSELRIEIDKLSQSLSQSMYCKKFFVLLIICALLLFAGFLIAILYNNS